MTITRAEARAAGLKRYNSGLPCPHGHKADRNTKNGKCVTCAYSPVKAWVAANREKDRARKAAWELANPPKDNPVRQAWLITNAEKVRAIKRKWAAANPESGAAWRDANRDKVRAFARAWAAAYSKLHPDRLRKRRSAWRIANAARISAVNKAWAAANPERLLAARHRRRARKAQAGGSYTPNDIRRIRERQRDKCAFCLQPFGKAKPQIDHYTPIKLGGSNDPSNLKLLHAKCNQSKGGLHPLDHALKHGLLCW